MSAKARRQRNYDIHARKIRAVVMRFFLFGALILVAIGLASASGLL